MSTATRASIDQVGFPLILLIAMVGLVATMGRISLLPVLARGREHEGTVRMYDPEEGFGLVTRDVDGSDIFIHRSAVRGRRTMLQPGDRVRFRVVKGEYRDMASRIVSAD